MKTLYIILFIIFILSCIRVEVNINNTIWKEKGTDRPIIVIRYNEDGVMYKYMEDPFERHMSLLDLITKYTYEGE